MKKLVLLKVRFLMEQHTLMEEKSLKQASEKLKYILKNHHNIPKS